jgi:hypothetical protein
LNRNVKIIYLGIIDENKYLVGFCGKIHLKWQSTFQRQFLRQVLNCRPLQKKSNEDDEYDDADKKDD